MNAHNLAAADFLPNSLEAEECLIGAVLMNNDAWLLASQLVEAEHFFQPLHRKIWQMLSERLNIGQSVTPITLIAALGPDKALDLGAGITIQKFMAHVCANGGTIANAPDYAGVVRDMWARRQLISLSREVGEKALGGYSDISLETILDETDAELGAIRFGKEVSGIGWLSDFADDSMQATARAYQGNGPVGLSFGVKAMDEIVGPLLPGDLVTLLAASGHGKTTLVTQALCRASTPSLDANQGKPSLLISQEMQGIEIARRVIAGQTGFSARMQKTGDVNEGEFGIITDAARGLKNISVLIDGSGPQTVSNIVKKMRAMKKRYDICAVGVDHVKLIRPENPRWSKIDTIINAGDKLKAAAKELGIVIFVLAQPTREGQKSDRTWRLSDQSVYGGDELKQFSDFMITFAIPEKWLRMRQPDPTDQKLFDKWLRDCEFWKGKAEFGTLKVRDGEDGNWATCGFNGKEARFSDLGP